MPERNETRSEAELVALARFKQLTEQALPQCASEHRWPVRYDHCFKRICLDWTFGGVWYDALPRPAERHLRGEDLARAVRCAEELLEDGLALLQRRNTASLQWRGKQKKAEWHPALDSH